jgi:polar amino acid transport system substrate-binding protein
MKSIFGRFAVGIFAAAVGASLGWGLARAQTAKPADSKAIEQGRDTFNSNCAHCHGEDAGAEDPFYNLPQLLSDKKDDFFFTTVTNGIHKVGMPPFKTVLKRNQMSDILVYLRSVEADQGLSDNGSNN